MALCHSGAGGRTALAPGRARAAAAGGGGGGGARSPGAAGPGASSPRNSIWGWRAGLRSSPGFESLRAPNSAPSARYPRAPPPARAIAAWYPRGKDGGEEGCWWAGGRAGACAPRRDAGCARTPRDPGRGGAGAARGGAAARANARRARDEGTSRTPPPRAPARGAARRARRGRGRATRGNSRAGCPRRTRSREEWPPRGASPRAKTTSSGAHALSGARGESSCTSTRTRRGVVCASGATERGDDGSDDGSRAR